jgi:hypothetical protein
MARARTGGGVAIWALTLFVIAFFFSLVMAIIFASQNAKEVEKADIAIRELKKVGRPNELLSVSPPAGQTIVGYLSKENSQLKRMISSDADLSSEVLDKMRTERNIERTLFDELTHLNNELSAAGARAGQAEAAKAAAETAAATAIAAKTTLDTQYNKTVADLLGQIKKVQGDFDQYRKDIRGSDEKLSSDLAELRRDKDQEIASLQQGSRQKDSEIARLRTEIRRLTEPITGVAGVENLVPSDGQITAVTGDDKQVYIDLGAQEHLLLGTTFEVFASEELVKTDEYDNARGKGTIEVIYIDEVTALCRVVRKSYRTTLRPGDKIINVVFDPKKTYRFHIYGDFDTNYDGEATELERKLVDSKIRSWGGVITDDLSYNVDYLVLGIEPPLPDALSANEIDPVLIARNVEQKRAYEQYHKLIGQARTLAVPVLNQNRFLALTGHYER